MATGRHGAGGVAAVVDLSGPDAATAARTGYKIVDLADENGSENGNGMTRTHSSSSSSSNSSSSRSSSSSNRIVTPTTPGRAMDVVTSDDDEDDGEHDMYENIHYDNEDEDDDDNETEVQSQTDFGVNDTANYLMELRKDLTDWENAAVNELCMMLPKQTDELLMIVMKTVRKYGADNPDEEDARTVVDDCFMLLADNADFQRANERASQEAPPAAPSAPAAPAAPAALAPQPAGMPPVPPTAAAGANNATAAAPPAPAAGAAPNMAAISRKSSKSGAASSSSSSSTPSVATTGKRSHDSDEVAVVKVYSPMESVLDVLPDADQKGVTTLLQRFKNDVEQTLQYMMDNGYEKRTIKQVKVVTPKIQHDFASNLWEPSSHYRSDALLQLQFDFPFIRVNCLRDIFAAQKNHYWHCLQKLETDLGVTAGQINFVRGGFSVVRYASVDEAMKKHGIQSKVVTKAR
jgi:hypothetical protein